MGNNNETDFPEQKEEEDEILKHCDFIESFMTTFGPGYNQDTMTKKAKDRMDEVKVLMAQFGTGSFPNDIKSEESKEVIKPGDENQGAKANSDTKDKPKLAKTTHDQSGSSTKTSTSKFEKKNTDSEESEASESSNESDSDTPSNPSNEKCDSKPNDQMSALELLTKALLGLDNRKAPSIESYDEKGSETLEEYIQRFEKYCQFNIKGDDSFWLVELRSKLTGETLDAFESITDKRDSYKSAKKKILRYDADMFKTRRKKSKNEFKAMKYNSAEESIYLYSIRLEKKFKQAYPETKVKYSEKLINKFASSVPKAFGKIIKEELMRKEAKRQRAKWETIKDFARIHDKNKMPDTTENLEEPEVIKINVNKNETPADSQAQGMTPNPSMSMPNSWGNGSYHQGNYNPGFGNSQAPRNTFNPRFPNYANRGGRQSAPPFTGRNLSFFNSRGRGNPQYRSTAPFLTGGNNEQPQYTEGSNSHPANNSFRGRGRGNNQYRMQAPAPIKKCYACGKVGHLASYCRTATQCFNCGEFGHMRKECPQQSNQSNKQSGGAQQEHIQCKCSHTMEPETSSKSQVN